MSAVSRRLREGDISRLPEWRTAAAFSRAVTAASEALAPPAELEWLRYLVHRSGAVLPAIIAEAWEREHLAEYLLGLYEALDHVALIEYYLLFLDEEALLPPGMAGALERERAAAQAAILAAVEGLRPFTGTPAPGSAPPTERPPGG